MRAEIDENGKLSVIPETGAEAFALRVWWEDYMLGQAEETQGGHRFAVLHIQMVERK